MIVLTPLHVLPELRKHLHSPVEAETKKQYHSLCWKSNTFLHLFNRCQSKVAANSPLNKSLREVKSPCGQPLFKKDLGKGTL